MEQKNNLQIWDFIVETKDIDMNLLRITYFGYKLTTLNENNYDRSVFNVLDFLSNVGGIEAILIGFVILMYSAIADHIFIMDAIQNFYIIKKPQNEIIFNKSENLNNKISRKMKKI